MLPMERGEYHYYPLPQTLYEAIAHNLAESG